MNKDSQELELQLNNEAPVEEYDLEDIMREFGGWTQEPEETAVSMEDTMVVPKTKPTPLTGDTIHFAFVQEEPEAEPEPAPLRLEPVEMPEEPEPEGPDPAQLRKERRAEKREIRRTRRLLRQRRKAARALQRAIRREEPEVVYPSPEEACAAYAKGGTLRLRSAACGLMFGAQVVLLILSQYSLGFLDLTGKKGMFSVLMLALLLGQSVLSADVFVRGVYQALKLRFDLMTLLVINVIAVVMDAFFAIPEGRVPFCGAVSMAMLVALRSVSLEKKAKWRTLKTALAMENPVAAVKEEKAWHDLDCIFRQEGSLEDFTAMLETPDAAQKTMRIYVPFAAVATFLLAVYGAFAGSGSFWWAWAGLLTGALPAGCFLACCRPFCLLAFRLHKAGAAICGWRGAKILSGESGIVMEDGDLFPADYISLNGMKMFTEMSTRQVVGYATAVVQAAGSGLLPLFEGLMKEENGQHYTVDMFRQYEGGGLGAEIRGDVVLLGSLAFMRLMGIEIPEGTRVQSAVYISVNREMVGVFALTYSAAPAAKSGLHQVLRSNGLTPILATRDFMITPGLVKKRYKVPAERMEFPMAAERTVLSAPEAGANGRQGALMARDSFAGFAFAVAGGRQLRKIVHRAVLLAILAGLMGMGLMFLLTYLGAVEAASAFNLLLYQVLWLLPSLLITGLVGKS